MTTLTDIFAGAGGSSTGAIAVPGVEVTRAANHWKLAVDVHHLNHPNTEHDCVDLHAEDPRRFPKTDILWASPECTKWSQANGKAKALSAAMGGDPTLFDDVPTELETSDQEEIDRSRLLMFDVLRFVEYHRYRAVVVENVVDIATQAKYARAWQAWRRGLTRLGYQFQVVSLNSMHAQAHGLPAPQSRDRLYIVAVPAGEKAPDITGMMRPRAWCARCEQDVESRQAWKNGRTVGRYRAQYIYVCTRCGHEATPGWLPASTAIDWTIQGQRIGDRERPLSPKTMARIREGLRRYAHEFIVEAGGNQYDACDPKHPQHGQPGAYTRAWPIDDPLRTLHTSPTKALLVPVEGRDGKEARPDSLPMRTQTCRNELGILTTLRGTNAPKTTREPLDTFAANGTHHGLLMPYYGTSRSAKPTSEPVGTLTTRDRYALLTPCGGTWNDTAYPAGQAMRTVTTRDTTAVVTSKPVSIDPEDCTFRMLEPHEIAMGMSFPADYQWAGSKRQRVKLAGNAVTPPAARDLIATVVESMS